MNTQEIIDCMVSRDTHKVWLAACKIIELGQEPSAILPLVEHLPVIRSASQRLDMGGAFFPNQRYIDLAIRTIEFYAYGSGCPCALYVGQSTDVEREQKKGYVNINETVYFESKWPDFFRVECKRCGKRFRVQERESHFTWWNWEYETPEASSANLQNQDRAIESVNASSYRFTKGKIIFLIPIIATFLVLFTNSSIIMKNAPGAHYLYILNNYMVLANVIAIFYVGFKKTHFFNQFLLFSTAPIVCMLILKFLSF